MKKFNTRMLVTMALLVAIEIVLSRFLSINAWNLKIGFSFIPIVIAAYLYGPICAGIVAAMGDFLGAILFPIGPYFPGFTLTAFLTGVVFGLFLYQKNTMGRAFLAVLINQLLLSLLLNTFWISFLYDMPFTATFMTRILQCAILFPLQALITRALAPAMKQIGRIAQNEA